MAGTWLPRRHVVLSWPVICRLSKTVQQGYLRSTEVPLRATVLRQCQIFHQKKAFRIACTHPFGRTRSVKKCLDEKGQRPPDQMIRTLLDTMSSVFPAVFTEEAGI